MVKNYDYNFEVSVVIHVRKGPNVLLRWKNQIFQDGDDTLTHLSAELVGSIMPTSKSYASVYAYTVNGNGASICRRNPFE